MNYSVILKKESGILIAAKFKYKMVNSTCTSHHNILTGRLIARDTIIRVIAVYGLQETRNAEERCDFFDQLSAEIENCSMHADTPIIAGDFNAKLAFSSNCLTYLSPNSDTSSLPHR